MRLATWVRDAKPSFIREILKFTQEPDVISFAGGMPAPERFPVQATKEAYNRVLQAYGESVLQYSPSEGELPLRNILTTLLSPKGIKVTADDVIITNGSQHGLDLVAKAFLRPGDAVLVESPTYLGALQAFAPYHPLLVPVPSDSEGMCPDALAAAIRVHRPKFVYLVPTFQNPTGRTMGLERRRQIVAACEQARVPIVEDDPYSELRYSGHPVPSLRALWDQVIYLGTLSKTLSPGMRLGWMVAPVQVLQAAKLGMQATCLNVSALTQWVAADLLARPEYADHLAQLRETYSERMNCMLSALKRYFPTESHWTVPEGGLFLWVTLPDAVRSSVLIQRAIDNRVAFVPGTPFYVEGGGENTMRLNFSNTTPELISEGIQRLGAAIESLVGKVMV